MVNKKRSSKSEKLDEMIFDERKDAKGNPVKTSMSLHENKTNKEIFIALKEIHKTNSGKWSNFGRFPFFLTIKNSIKFIKGLLKWSKKYDIDMTELSELREKPIVEISQELNETRMALEKYKQINDSLSLELSKREDEFKKNREDDFKGRINEFKDNIKKFEALIENFEKNKSKEEDLQTFLEEHPWFLGLYYKDFKPQKITGMGRFDFYLKRFDDSEEVIELKRVDVNFINVDGAINADFAQALDQMLRYFDDIQDITFSPRISKKFSINEFYPHGILIFGFKPTEKTKAFINKWKNALRLEINTYDEILEKFKITVQNLEKKEPINN